ncbi:hypothetical protein [Sedimenticola hydrogenitrophicus]|nr:hypothetical protein [Sedimenticola hydrogenitrophicus]
MAVNYDENPELARRLGVKFVPTTLLLSPEAEFGDESICCPLQAPERQQ